MPHSVEATELAVAEFVRWIRLGAELVGVVTIVIGLLATLLLIARVLDKREALNFNLVRLSFARYLALALEFQLGADILSTAVNPKWEELKILGGIAVIRTALNFFLTKEMNDEGPKAEEKVMLGS